MDLLNPIYTEKAECRDCYKCVRECSSKAIRVEGGRAAVIPELCVLCGHCVEVCPVGAKRVRDDLPRVKRLVADANARGGLPVLASLAPSFASEFPGLGEARMVAALRRLGFTAVAETARGADVVARMAALRLRSLADHGAGEGTAPLLISSACPTVVARVLKYRRDFEPYLDPAPSPLMAHAEELKSLYGRGAAVVFIGPCISKKGESDDRRDLIDVAIDFGDLRRWFDEQKLKPETLAPGPEDRFVPGGAGKGALYPMDGGMIAAVKRYGAPESTRFLSFSGMEALEAAIDGLEPRTLTAPVFLELLACPGGCVNGPRALTRSATAAKRISVLDYAQEKPLREVNPVSTATAIRAMAAVGATEVGAEQLAEALRRTGKFSPDDELNCGGCGYDSCRDFARAMIAGRAELNMCVSYMRKLAQKKANSLIKAIPSGVVIVDADLKVVECNRNFVALLGKDAELLWDAKPGLEGADLERLVPFAARFREILDGAEALDRDLRLGNRVLRTTIFCIERGAYVGGVFQDITAPWVRKDRVVSQARKVITKNLAVVQKIAFLLGENAAESEAILNSIIESFDGRTGEAPRNPGKREPRS